MRSGETNSGGHVAEQLAMIRSFLREAADMPKRYQDPKLQKRTDVSNHFWFIRVRVPDPSRKMGRRVIKLGFVSEMNAKQAKEARVEALQAINAGLLFVQARKKFREVVKVYMDTRIAQLGIAAAKRYTGSIKKHILPAFGDRQLADIDRAMVEAWLIGKERDGLGYWSRWGLRGILSVIFEAAKEWKFWTGENPAHGARIGRETSVRGLQQKEPLKAAEIQAILVAVSPDTSLMILIGSLLGLRISETMGLRWLDIDFEAGTVTIRRRWYRGDLAEETKSESGRRTLKLGPLVGDLRNRYPGPHLRERFIFLGEDGENPPDERDILRYELRPALKRLKLHYPGMGWHAFRRLSITWRQQAGATPFEAQKAAGHASMEMTLAYTLVDLDRQEEHTTKMYDAIMGRAEGPKQ